MRHSRTIPLAGATACFGRSLSAAVEFCDQLRWIDAEGPVQHRKFDHIGPCKVFLFGSPRKTFNVGAIEDATVNNK